MLFLATDHRGLTRKNQLKTWLREKKIAFKDLGAYELDPADDYPDFAQLLTAEVNKDPQHRGVIFCGSGAGVCIAANKMVGVRCAIGLNHRQVAGFTEHDHVNVLAIAADHTTKFKLFQLVKTFLNTTFSDEERHIRRLEKVRGMEKSSSSSLPSVVG